MIKLDMRNKICPYPVIQTKKNLKMLKEHDTIEILVDNIIATQNLEKMATELGFSKSFSITKNSDTEFFVTIVKGMGDNKEIAIKDAVTKSYKNNIISISNDCMGTGSESLSKKLLEGFIYSLTEQDENIMPTHIIFYNKGVFLTTSNEKTIEDLKILQNKGVAILSCGLCLDFYNLTNKLEVGQITNMYSITEFLLTSNTININ